MTLRHEEFPEAFDGWDSPQAHGREQAGGKSAVAWFAGATAVVVAGVVWGVPWFKGEVADAYHHLHHDTGHSQPYRPGQDHDPIQDVVNGADH